MNVRNLGSAVGALALLLAGCGETTSTEDLSMTKVDMTVVTPPDMTDTGDMAKATGDMAMLPPDMTIVYRPTVIIEEVSTTIAVGGMPVAVRGLVPVLVNPDPAKAKPSDFDNSNALGLGCSANHYVVGGGDDPTPDVTMGTVTLSGYAPGTPVGGMAAVPAEINCALGATGYSCGYGPLNNGMAAAANLNTTFFPGNMDLIAAGKMITVKYDGGNLLGTFMSSDLTATDPLTVMEDLTKIKYDPAADSMIHFACVNKPQNCFDAVLVQMVASSVVPGMPGYPGADYGTLNCAAVGGSSITIPKEAIAAMFGNTGKIVFVRTVVVRGALPPSGLKDSKTNPVRLALGRGVLGYAPK